MGQKKCFFTCLYRNPSIENNTKEIIDEFSDELNNTLDNIKGKNPYINLVVGDFNAKNTTWWGDTTDYPGERISDITNLHGLHEIINQPTHLYPGKSPTCIDQFFCSQPNLISESGVLPSLLPQCHHDIIYAKIDFNVKSPPPYKRPMWDYKNADVTSIRRSLTSINWVRCNQHRNPNNQVEFLTDCILNSFSNFCPNRIITCRHKDAPWMTNEIKLKLKEKTNIYKKYVKNKYDLGYKQLLHEKMNETSNLITNAKNKYYVNEGKKLLDPALGPKKYWSILNSFLGNKKMPIIPPLFENDEVITDYSTKAEIFNTYFASQCTPLDDSDVLPDIASRTILNLSSVTISKTKILEIIRALDSNKSSGWDGISPQMLKICDESIVTPIHIIFDTCIREGIFPDKWKMSNVCPVHKKGLKNIKSNYRPISLLPILGKIFEKVIFDSLYDFLTNNKFLTSCQSGFIKGDSCVNQLLAITHEIHKNLDANPSIDTIGVFLDMSKAFDKVWHNGLICKLKSYGIQSKLLALLNNYLSYRKQRVVINGVTSSWKPIISGVPQGSVLGPLLFLVFINDLPDNLTCNPKLFADDVSLNAVMHDKDVSTQNLKDDLNRLLEWSTKWKMVFNPEPSKPAEEVIFTNRNSTAYESVSYSGVDVMPVDYHKHLGFTLDSKMNFIKHIDSKISKANQGIGILKRLYNYRPRNSLIQIYKSFIRPHLDYCDVIYHKPMYDDFYCQYYSERAISDPINTNYLFNNKIESVQYNASLAITGCVRGTNRERLYSELGLMSLYDRRRFHRLSFFYKILNQLTPEYLRCFIPIPTRRLHVTRANRDVVIQTRTLKFRYSFFPDASKSWNHLSNFIKSSPTLNVFKQRFMEFFNVTPYSIYGIHNPHGMKYLTRLRVGLSHLHAHKYNHNFKDTVSRNCLCQINESETVEHYLLHCPTYSLMRAELFGKLRLIISLLTLISPSYTCNLLLYGNPSYDFHTNQKILELTISFILSSKRFEGPFIQ